MGVVELEQLICSVGFRKAVPEMQGASDVSGHQVLYVPDPLAGHSGALLDTMTDSESNNVVLGSKLWNAQEAPLWLST